MVSEKYLYKVCLDTASSVAELAKIASEEKGSVSIVSNDMRVNAKSILGVLYAKVVWEDIYVESQTDIGWKIRKFIRE